MNLKMRPGKLTLLLVYNSSALFVQVYYVHFLTYSPFASWRGCAWSEIRMRTPIISQLIKLINGAVVAAIRSMSSQAMEGLELFHFLPLLLLMLLLLIKLVVNEIVRTQPTPSHSFTDRWADLCVLHAPCTIKDEQFRGFSAHPEGNILQFFLSPHSTEVAGRRM